MKEWGEGQGETEPYPLKVGHHQAALRGNIHKGTPHTHTQAGLGASLGVPTLSQVKLASFPCQCRKYLRQSRKPLV